MNRLGYTALLSVVGLFIAHPTQAQVSNQTEPSADADTSQDILTPSEASQEETTSDAASSPPEDGRDMETSASPLDDTTSQASEGQAPSGADHPFHDPRLQRRSLTEEGEPLEYHDGTPEMTLAGGLTIGGAAIGFVGTAILIERISAVDGCASLAAEDPPTMGCVNMAQVASERDIGIGVLIGGYSLAVVGGVLWALFAATQSDDASASDGEQRDPEAVTLQCLPGVFSFACRARF